MALVAAFAPPVAQLAVLGAFISILGGLFLSYLGQEDQRERQRAAVIESLSVPLSLAADPDLFRQYQDISRGLAALVNDIDPILRRIALLKLASLAGQINALATGQAVFAFTEVWRTVYEELLRSPQVRKYRSVAWARTADYWQDAPGRQSMSVNYEAVNRRGVLVERTIILRDALWPRDQLLPVGAILPWIEEQHNHGLWVCVVREADLAREPDLLCDLGIYGDRAVGVQELDEHSRTLRFTLTFGEDAVRPAQELWRRLSLYAVPWRTLLDRLPRAAKMPSRSLSGGRP
jgi:hypothetical protein